jgi:hypothetical protein
MRTQSSTGASQSGTSAENTQDNATATVPPPPAHNYVYVKDGEYGYQPEISQDQLNAGQASAALVMVRYLGEHQGVYRVEVVEGGAYGGTLSCASPCSYVTVKEYDYDGELVDREIAPAGSTIGFPARTFGIRRWASDANA